MDWTSRFQLFLFDFDGLLVNTEPLHYQAYVNCLAARGFQLSLSYGNFLQLAHLNSTAWKEAVCAEIPSLEPIWKSVYQEKKEAYVELLGTAPVELMPGVFELLQKLEREEVKRCVVTHSTLSHIQLIRARSPILQTIPHWITREDYEKPKPSPECYLKAIAMYGEKGDRIIGFEDSVRGFTALKGTPALPVLICPSHHPLLEMALEGGGLHFESFSSIFDLVQK